NMVATMVLVPGSMRSRLPESSLRTQTALSLAAILYPWADGSAPSPEIVALTVPADCRAVTVVDPGVVPPRDGPAPLVELQAAASAQTSRASGATRCRRAE